MTGPAHLPRPQMPPPYGAAELGGHHDMSQLVTAGESSSKNPRGNNATGAELARHPYRALVMKGTSLHERFPG